MAESNMRGRIDGVQGNALTGWIVDVGAPDEELEIGLMTGETLVSSAKPNLYRDDLERYGIASGHHGFALKIDPATAEMIAKNAGQCSFVRVKPKIDLLGSVVIDDSRLQQIFLGSYTFHVDRASRDKVSGWCKYMHNDQASVVLGLYLNDRVIMPAHCAIFRPDVELAGFGHGRYGFEFAFSAEILSEIDDGDAELALRDIRHPYFKITDLRIEASSHIGIRDPRFSSLQEMIFPDVIKLKTLLDKVPSSFVSEHFAVPDPLYENLFHKVQIPGTPNDKLPGTLPIKKLSGFLDYSRYRMGQNGAFDVDGIPDSYDHFLFWYIANYGKHLGALRAPLAKDEIEFLNDMVTIGGQRFALSRATWSFLLNDETMRSTLDLESFSWYTSAVYWWAVKKAPEFCIEDCLVPDSYIRHLRAVPSHWRQLKTPFSNFMESYLNEGTIPFSIWIDQEEDRITFLLIMILMALSHPGYLRYLPTGAVKSMFRRSGKNPSQIESFLQAIYPLEKTWSLEWEHYTAVLAELGYNADLNTYKTVSSRGHRVLAAALPRVSARPEVDVQVIGPLAKASGLGQAARLSAAALQTTGLSLNLVDFGMDNPAPEGFSSEAKTRDFCRAKINLIHLNAESVPLAIAYCPDVFSGAYNIGYFFWELDSPAACHYLALNLLDEVWVSTDYGAAIYSRSNAPPVHKVGMSFEDVAQPSRLIARRFVEKRYPVSKRDFVFLAVFDSFSFVQRKNPIGVLIAFQAAFQGVNDVKLILKTQNREGVEDPNQIKIWSKIDAIANGDERIIIINETLSYSDLILLKKGSDCYVSLHRSEGWGFGMIEAMNLKVPVVCTGYSGNMEFCSSETAWLVDCDEIAVDRNDYIYVSKGQHWGEPRIESAAMQLREVFSKVKERQRKVENAWRNIQERFGVKQVGERYKMRIDEILGAKR